mgnify:CR=1 FL=1
MVFCNHRFCFYVGNWYDEHACAWQLKRNAGQPLVLVISYHEEIINVESHLQTNGGGMVLCVPLLHMQQVWVCWTIVRFL